MTDDTMWAIGAYRGLPIDDPASLQDLRMPVPELREHDLLVEVLAVSVNPVDVKSRAALEPSDEPTVLGYDAAGIVSKIGSAVTLFAPGDHVFYAGSNDRAGSNAQFQAVDERIVGRKPASIPFIDAAALPLTSLTAWETLFERFGLTSESTGTLFVVGATGGVGLVMLQLAEALLPGIRVIATAHGEDAVQHVTELGAEATVDHHADLEPQLRALAPDGVEYLFTSKSKGQIDLYAAVVATGGHIVAIDDEHQDLYALKSKSIAWHWEFMFAKPTQQAPDLITQHEALNAVADLVDSGRMLSTASDRLAPLDAATLRRAHALVEGAGTRGKVVVALHD
ncbi:zinc-binding alcohol dehydrogenase family protein [Subtercola endophyticus]|uniref:zinc-binding alcohol dehydrogenase family protein n=1 Tax=Subtercola endophyticus TaxID=2895559 RepID=UPI001E3ADE58|nr:zinc-binding alcohol dehydrogenase family protein [Subtercola endophyticus]UFS58218.1 zinc-binding alcohol dehydrogenase family protein [Subtercola endophyticus]